MCATGECSDCQALREIDEVPPARRRRSAAEIVDLCGDGFCMERASCTVTIQVRWNRRAATTSVVGKLCDRHVEAIRTHADKRMREDARLSVVVTAKKIPIHEGPPR